ncbi:LysM peptidoglycan-binding domain-containing protein [Luteolibacter algae]|uniref:LysM peptidoglycan-binding domain-containing protein n=1 Tax=Luteolibacter algae TaxID=454151 RepID=A0ABW5D889_9BACT
MKFWLFIKIIAGLGVIGIVAFTAMLSYHIVVEPLGGVFERIVPEAGSVLKVPKEEDFAKVLDAAEMPDFEPGDRAFQKAHELIALGEIPAGREKLMAIINVFPSSPAAPNARRIVSQMNLDEILASNFPEGKTTYTVKSGDSYYAIASRHDISLDMLMHLNGMMELKNLQPGDDLLVMPLNYRLMIEPDRKSVSLWDGVKFICEYPVLNMDGINLNSGKTVISSRRSTLDGKTVAPTAKNYRATRKSIVLKSPAIQIFPYDESEEDPPRGIYLREADMEELFLLTRSGNEVEIRKSAR